MSTFFMVGHYYVFDLEVELAVLLVPMLVRSRPVSDVGNGPAQKEGEETVGAEGYSRAWG